MDQEELEKLHAVIVAGGAKSRLGGPVPRHFLSLQGRPLIDWSLAAFQALEEVAGIVLVVPGADISELSERLRRERLDSRLLAVVAAGGSRFESVRAGLAALPPDIEWVAIHDAVRPYVTPQLIRATFSLAQQTSAAIPTVAIGDSLVQVDEAGMLVRAISRDYVKRAQTPQIFKSELLAEAEARSLRDGVAFADEAAMLRHYGFEVATFVHHGENRKISTPQDMEKILMQKSDINLSVRVGQGYARHPFCEEDGKTLILGGVRFVAERGLRGLADADVLTQAVIDAILGGAGLGDLMQHFPASEAAYKNASSLSLLQDAAEMLRKRGLLIAYIDVSVLGEKPRLASRRDDMRERLAGALSIDPDCISIKNASAAAARLGAGDDGLAALAVVTLAAAPAE